MGHLNEHRFNHNFQNCISPLCSCSFETESTSHFLMHWHHYKNIHSTLTNSIGNTFNATNEYLDNLSLFGSPKYTQIDNSQIINATINYLAHFFNLPNILILVIFPGYWFWIFYLFLTLMLIISTTARVVVLWYCYVLNIYIL